MIIEDIIKYTTPDSQSIRNAPLLISQYSQAVFRSPDHALNGAITKSSLGRLYRTTLAAANLGGGLAPSESCPGFWLTCGRTRGSCPFDAVSIIDIRREIAYRGRTAWTHRLMALHVVGRTSVGGENPKELMDRRIATPSSAARRKAAPGSLPGNKHDEGEMAGEPIACDDLLQKARVASA